MFLLFCTFKAYILKNIIETDNKVGKNGKGGGIFKGDRHSAPSGGIDVSVSGAGKVLVEDSEALLVPEISNIPKKYNFNGKQLTAKEVASEINQKYGGVPIKKRGGEVEKPHKKLLRELKEKQDAVQVDGGAIVITRNAVLDEKTKNSFNGEKLTNKEILSRLNEDAGGESFDDVELEESKEKGGNILTYKEKYNKKYNYPLNKSHSLEEIHIDTGISLKGLQEIYNKGIGAYKTNPKSVRPNVKSKEQWAMARVYSAVMGGDAARIDKKELKLETGGVLDNQKEFINWFKKWYNEDIFSKINIAISYPSVLHNLGFEDKNGAVLELFEKRENTFGAKPHLREIIKNADKYGINLYLVPTPRYKYIKDKSHKEKITKEYLIEYYKKFGFEPLKYNQYFVRYAKESDVLLAPNGKPSNLTREQWHLVRTPQFKKWSNNWKDVVKDDNGEPQVLYSGSPNLFTKFDRKFIGTNATMEGRGFYFTSNKKIAEGYAENGYLYEVFVNVGKNISYDKKTLTKTQIKTLINNLEDKGIDILSNWGDVSYDGKNKVLNEALNAYYDNDNDVDIINGMFNDIGQDYTLYDELIKMGYRGTEIKSANWGEGQKIVVSFSPNDIKLADGTNTTFDYKNEDIRFKYGGNILLAPNGKPSNLNAEQWHLVRSKNFIAWFGDWINDPENASKVVDENGEPLVCYHRTNSKFNIFDKEKLGVSSGWETAYFGFYFSNKNQKGYYGKKVMKCFLSIKNPYFIETENYSDFDYEYKRFDPLNFKNNDGIYINVRRLNFDEKADKHFVAFEPTQIKLADGTNTTFNSNNPDIRYEEGGKIKDYKTIASFKNGSAKIYSGKLSYKDLLKEAGETPINIEHIEVFSKEKDDDFLDFYEYSKKQVAKMFGSEFEQGYPTVEFIKDKNSLTIEEAFGILKNGENVYYSKDKLEWCMGYAKGGELSGLELINQTDGFGEKYSVIVNGIKQGSISFSNGTYFASSNSTQGGKSFTSKFFDTLDKATKYIYNKTKDVYPLNKSNIFKQMGYEKGGFLRFQEGNYDVYAEEIKNWCENNGLNFRKLSKSKTDYGESHYYEITKNGEYPLKVRISDHSVENVDRMRNEVHFRVNGKVWDEDFTNGIEKIEYYFFSDKYEKVPIKEIQQIYVFKDQIRPTDKLLGKEFITKKGDTQYLIERERITDFFKIKRKEPLIYEKGGKLDDKEEIYKKWKSLVNMSKSELENFYNSEEGKEAGLSSSEAKELGIHSGRESARWIMKMKDTPHNEWTPKMWEWANRQISFISRMKGNKGGLYDEKGNKTRKHTSLLIWGHNPEKFEYGGMLGVSTYKGKLLRGNKTEIQDINDLYSYSGMGEAGRGVYFFKPSSSMQKYYTSNGEYLIECKVKDGYEIINLDDEKDTLIRWLNSNGYSCNSSNYQKQAWGLMAYMNLKYPDAIGYLVQHKGIGIPTGSQIVISYLEGIELVNKKENGGTINNEKMQELEQLKQQAQEELKGFTTEKKEHETTLENLEENKINVDEAISEIVESHLEENPSYYDDYENGGEIKTDLVFDITNNEDLLDEQIMEEQFGKNNLQNI